MSSNQKNGILFLEALPTIAGGQTVLLNLVPALREHYRLATLLPGEGLFAEALRAEGVECFFAPIGRYSLMNKSSRDVVAYAMRMPLLMWRAARLIRRWGADLVYANSGPTFLWGALAAQLTGRPIIWHHHNLFSDGKTLTSVRGAARLPSVRTIICASAAAEEQFSNVSRKAIVIPNGVDTERFRPNQEARTRVRQELRIGNTTSVIGMVGDLIPLKHQDTLLNAVSELANEVPDMQVLLVGDERPGNEESAHYAEQLRQEAPHCVHFLGRRSDLPDVLNALDLLVIASERETGPLVLLEALATGIPVVSTPVGRAIDLLGDESLFPVGNAKALADRLGGLLVASAYTSENGLSSQQSSVQQLSLVTFRNEISAVIARSLPQNAE